MASSALSSVTGRPLRAGSCLGFLSLFAAGEETKSETVGAASRQGASHNEDASRPAHKERKPPRSVAEVEELPGACVINGSLMGEANGLRRPSQSKPAGRRKVATPQPNCREVKSMGQLAARTVSGPGRPEGQPNGEAYSVTSKSAVRAEAWRPAESAAIRMTR